jgi:drug/metabolite transporter (DMT)-like permease
MGKELTRGIVSLVLASFLFSLWGVFPRFIGLSFGIFFQSLARSAITIPFLLAIFFLFKKKWKGMPRQDYLWILAMSSFGFVSVITFFVAINKLAVGTTYFIFYASATLSGFFLGKFIFQEKLTTIKALSLLVCLTGLFLVFSIATQESNPLFVLLAALSGVGGGGWNVLSKKVSLKYSLIQISIIDYLNFFIFALPAVLILREPISFPDFSVPWLATISFSFITMLAVFMIFNGFRYVPAQTGTLLMLLEPVFAVFLGWLFFKEILSLRALAGGALILIGTAMPFLRKD